MFKDQIFFLGFQHASSPKLSQLVMNLHHWEGGTATQTEEKTAISINKTQCNQIISLFEIHTFHYTMLKFNERVEVILLSQCQTLDVINWLIDLGQCIFTSFTFINVLILRHLT